MTKPTTEDFAALFIRFANAGWISRSELRNDPKRLLDLDFTALGEIRMETLFEIVEELKGCAPSDGEFSAFLGLVICFGQRKNPDV